MALEKLSKSTFGFYAPRFEVEIEEQKLPAPMAKSIIDVSVDEKLDEGASFALTLYDEFDMKTQSFKWLDHKLIQVGNKISIKMGYENDLHTMMSGLINAVEPSFFAGETPTIVISGHDFSFDYLKKPSPERTFVDKSYSNIVETIANEAGMTPKVDVTGKYEHSLRKGSDTTYYAFIETIAKRSERTFYVERDKLYFVKPKDEKKEVITLSLGKDLISFRPVVNSANQVSEIEVRGHNPDDPSTPLVGRARAGEERAQESGRRTGSQISQQRHGNIKKVITDVVVTSVEHAQAIALAELNRHADTFITGDGESVGIPAMRPGITIMLEKMGKRFSGKYYVKSTTHTIDGSGYRTRFSVKKNAI